MASSRASLPASCGTAIWRFGSRTWRRSGPTRPSSAISMSYVGAAPPLLSLPTRSGSETLACCSPASAPQSRRAIPRYLLLLGRFVTSQSQLEMPLHIGPFTRENAVHHTVANRSVDARLVVTDDAVPLGAQGLNRSLRGKIETVGAEADRFASKPIERMAEQQELATGIDVTAVPASGIPGVTDLHAFDGGHDVVIASRADD